MHNWGQWRGRGPFCSDNLPQLHKIPPPHRSPWLQMEAAGSKAVWLLSYFFFSPAFFYGSNRTSKMGFIGFFAKDRPKERD